MTGDVEQIGLDVIILVKKQSGNGQCVAAVVTRTGKDDDRGGILPVVGDSLSQGLRRPLHQVNGRDGLILYRVFIQLVDLGTGEYLHSSG